VFGAGVAYKRKEKTRLGRYGRVSCYCEDGFSG
jgi:hypothetical protein